MCVSLAMRCKHILSQSCGNDIAIDEGLIIITEILDVVLPEFKCSYVRIILQ